MDVIGELLSLRILTPWLLGMAFGVFIGATPGLTATMGVALVVPISFYLPPAAGLALILGVSFTAIFAGDIPATYLRIPGTPASAAATLDNFAMAKKGRSSLALGLDLYCSAIGGLIGVLLLIFVAPQLAKLGLKFGSWELFWLSLWGLSMSAVVSTGSTFRGILAAAAGMFLATVGLDMVSGKARFTFGNAEMSAGLGFIPAMIGLFGLSEVLRSIHARATMSAPAVSPTDKISTRELATTIWRNKWTVLKSSLIGTFIGALPGAGADIAAFAAYGVAQRTSKRPEEFGKGSEEGVIAPTSANNAAVGGAWIPALVLGIPGDSVTAIVIGALMMYNIKPGPFIFQQHPKDMQAVFAIAVITQFLLIPAGLLGIKGFGYILRLPRGVVLTGVVVFSVLGSYAIRNSMFDVWLMVGFGVLGFFMEKVKVPLAPLILGMILGPMVEENLRVGLINGQGSWGPFFTRPICVAIIVLLAATAFVPSLLKAVKKPPKAVDAAEPTLPVASD